MYLLELAQRSWVR